jgi:hypothetical protein
MCTEANNGWKMLEKQKMEEKRIKSEVNWFLRFGL